jgi:hypothetical protein
VNHHELKAELAGATNSEPLSLDDKWERIKEGIGYTRNHAGKEWIDKECEKANESYSKTKEIYLFRKKPRKPEGEALIEIERLNDVKRTLKVKVAICWVKNGELLTNKDQVLSR